MSNTDAITGREDEIDKTTTIGALRDFYRAFNGRDLAGLEANWLNDDSAVMDNPVGGIMRGWPAIRAVYERLVAGEARVAVEFHDYSIVEAGEVMVAIGRERGTLTRGDLRLDLAIRTRPAVPSGRRALAAAASSRIDGRPGVARRLSACGARRVGPARTKGRRCGTWDGRHWLRR